MNILHITGRLPDNNSPSSQPFVKSQIDSLGKCGIDISILNINGDDTFFNYFTAAKKIKDIIKKNKIDIIHAHYSYSAIPALLAKTKIPIVVSLMGSDILGTPSKKGRMTFRGIFDKKLSYFIVNKVNHIIVKSNEMKSKINVDIPLDVIPNGVDFDFFRPIDKNLVRKQLNIKENIFVVLFLGNPKNYVKNFELARKSFEKLQRTFPNVEFLTPYGISPKEVVNYLNASDVLLFTSFWEGSPNLIKESQACNLPIISTDVGDVKEILSDTNNCFIVPFDENIIYDKLSVIYYNRTRTNGRQKVQHFK